MTRETEPSLLRDIDNRHVTIEAKAHARWSWSGFDSHVFAADYLSVPVLLGELAQVAVCGPVLFEPTPEGHWPVLMLTCDEDAGHLVLPNGQWVAPYVPAMLRGHPFSCDFDARLKLDPDSRWLHRDGRGQRLFDETGRPTEHLEKIKTFFSSVSRLMRATRNASAALEQAGLLVPAARISAFGAPRFQSYKVIDQAALANLDDNAVIELFRARALELAHMQLTSLAATLHLKHLGKSTASRPRGRSTSQKVDGFLNAMAADYDKAQTRRSETP